MTEDRVLTILRESTRNKDATRDRGTRNTDEELSDGKDKGFARTVDAALLSDTGAFFLHGWIDDRSSPLRQMRICGRKWSKSLDSQYLGRSRRRDIDILFDVQESRLFGFWSLTQLDDLALVDEDICSVEFILSDGTSTSSDVKLKRCRVKEFREQAINFLKPLQPADRLLPSNPMHIEGVLRPTVTDAKRVFPKHNVESVIIANHGGLFIVGWIDDTVEELDKIRVVGNEWQVVFTNDELARTCRDDVQSALGVARRHPFAYWGFVADSAVKDASSHCTVELFVKSGLWQRLEAPIRVMESIELRNVILTYVGSSQYLGNPQLAAVTCVAKSIGRHIVDLNLAITNKIVSQPYVERFGNHDVSRKGSIIVCLYGKPEYIFVQNALFSGLPGIEDYEFVYVSNSPEIAERLLREARIISLTSDRALTLVLLPGNAGFGAANNVAVEQARTQRLLIVNPDVFPFDHDWAAKHSDIVEQLPAHQTKIFGAPLYYDDGSLMHGGMYFDADSNVSLERSMFRRETLLRVEHFGKGAPPLTHQFLRPRPVPAVTGAFMSCDRNWFEKLGGFTEDYVLGHYEDADLCLKSIENGIAPWIHDLKLWHLEGKGSIRPPVLDGASAINRWLFNKRWITKVTPNILGQSPHHQLLKTESADAVTTQYEGNAPNQDGTPTSAKRRSGRSLTDGQSVGLEIVFETGGTHVMTLSQARSHTDLQRSGAG